MDLPTYEDLRQIARDELLTTNSKITAEAADLPGTDVYAFLAADAAVGDELSGQLARLQAALLLASARGTDLDRLAFDRYGVVRKPAAPSVGLVNFKVLTPAVSAFSIPAKITLETVDGLQFITTAEVLFPAAATDVTAPVRATVAGLATQARAGTITNIVGVIPGAPADLAANNTTATAGAADAELDDSLRARALNFFLTARRGTLEAIKQAALAFPGVVTASAIEALDGFGRPAGAVQLIVSDQFTETLAQQLTVPPAYETQSELLADQVFDALIDARAAGIYVAVSVAKVVIQTVILALNFRAGFDVAETATQARAQVVAYVNSLSPGMPFLVTGAVAGLRLVPGLLVSGAEILNPPGDVSTMPLEVLRTSLAYVSISSAAGV